MPLEPFSPRDKELSSDDTSWGQAFSPDSESQAQESIRAVRGIVENYLRQRNTPSPELIEVLNRFLVSAPMGVIHATKICIEAAIKSKLPLTPAVLGIRELTRDVVWLDDEPSEDEPLGHEDLRLSPAYVLPFGVTSLEVMRVLKLKGLSHKERELIHKALITSVDQLLNDLVPVHLFALFLREVTLCTRTTDDYARLPTQILHLQSATQIALDFKGDKNAREDVFKTAKIIIAHNPDFARVRENRDLIQALGKSLDTVSISPRSVWNEVVRLFESLCNIGYEVKDSLSLVKDLSGIDRGSNTLSFYRERLIPILSRACQLDKSFGVAGKDRDIEVGLATALGGGRVNDIRLWEEVTKIFEFLVDLGLDAREALRCTLRGMGSRPDLKLLQGFYAQLESSGIELDILLQHLSDISNLNLFPHFIRQLRDVKDGKTNIIPIREKEIYHRYVTSIEAFLLAHAADPKRRKEHITRLARLTGADSRDILYSVSDEKRAYMKEQVAFYGPSIRYYGDQLSSKPADSVELIPPAQSALNTWGRLADIHFGFGRLLNETKRTPAGESPLLVRFGLDIGQVSFLNVSNATNFPGKGFIIEKLNPQLTFYADSRAKDPYREYKRAWPKYAQAIDDISKAQFIFTRGFIAISCEGGIYTLQESGHKAYSLLIFNSHFENLFGRTACLIPTDELAGFIGQSTIPSEDFIGFSADRVDLSKSLPSLEKLLKTPYAIAVGSPGVITHGLKGHLHNSWKRFQDELEAHDRKIKDFDKRFRKNGNSGSLFREESRLHSEAGLLVYKAGQIEKEYDFIKVTDRLLNLFDVFRIMHSYWHKGYTTSSDSEQGFESVPDEEEGTYINPLASRMLRAAHEWHMARYEGESDLSRFPVFVITDTLAYSAQPTKVMYLDSYDMRFHANGSVTQFGTKEIGMEDEIAWATHVLPMAQDEPGKFRDIVPLSRLALDL